MDYEVYNYLDEAGLASEPAVSYQTVAVKSINNELSLAGHIVNETGANLFLTGKAGTGKTTFLRRLRETSGKRMVVLAPTGVAAINAEGVTIHSFFQLGFSPYIPGKGFVGETNSKHFSFSKQKRRLIATLDLLVIDEISMVRPDTLDAVDATLRRLRGSSLPFGGVQLLLIGDLRQLSPVVRDMEWEQLKPYYASPYFFESHSLKNAGFLTIELQTVYRQTDKDFINVLNAVRNGNVTREVLDILNRRANPALRPLDDTGYINLTTHNYAANNHNASRLAALPTPEVSFRAVVTGDFPESSYPAEPELRLKEGAQVMFIKNDSGNNRQYYNGLIGKVIAIGQNTVTVKPDNGADPIEVGYVDWENNKYTLNEVTGEISSEKVGTFSQIPLRLAWSITIHKSQGLTFDKAIIDAVNSFAPGQTYVALSRCRTLDGLILSSPISPSAVIVDTHVNDFMSSYEQQKPDGTTLSTLRDEYTRSLIAELFDFNPIRRGYDDFVNAMRSFVIPVIPEMKGELEGEYIRVLQKIVDVANKFKALYLAGAIDPSALPETFLDKIKNGAAYFAKELYTSLLYLSNLRVNIDNKSYINRLNTLAEDLKFHLMVKRDILASIAETGFSTADYSRAKTLSVLKNEDGKAQLYARKTTTKEKKEKKEKKPKGYTRYLTLELFNAGKSIEEIAKERSLMPSTIAGHLGSFIESGELAIDRVISPETLGTITAIYESGLTGADAAAAIEARGIPRYLSGIYYATRRPKSTN